MMSAARLTTARARSDAEEGRTLLRALRSAAHVHAGFGSFAEYVGKLFAHGARFTYEKRRVAEALERLPVLSAALEFGALHWSAARELTRVAAAETQAAWLDVARGKSLRQIEALVAGANPEIHWTRRAKRPAHRSAATCCASRSRAKRSRLFAKR
jgi:hypothetical protein